MYKTVRSYVFILFLLIIIPMQTEKILAAEISENAAVSDTVSENVISENEISSENTCEDRQSISDDSVSANVVGDAIEASYEIILPQGAKCVIPELAKKRTDSIYLIANDNARAVKVSNKGIVAAVKPGEANVTITRDGRIDTIAVRVSAAGISNASMKKNKLVLLCQKDIPSEGDEDVLEITDKLTGECTSYDIAYTSSRPDVVSIVSRDEVRNGQAVLTAQKAGVAKVTAVVTGKCLKDGAESEDIMITPVRYACSISSVDPVIAPQTISLTDKKRKGKISVKGVKAAVTYSCDNEGVAKVSAKGAVTACGSGEATITAMVSAEGFSRTFVCPVIVTGLPDAPPIDISEHDYSLVPDSENAIYVSPLGDDAGEGSKYNPYKTLQKAADNVTPGQNIYLYGGAYYGYSSIGVNGSPDKIITIRNYPGEDVSIRGIDGRNGNLLDLSNSSYVTVQGLELCYANAARVCAIMMQGSADHITIKDCRIHDIVTTRPKSPSQGEANAILCYGDSVSSEDNINNIILENLDIYNNITGWCESVSFAGNVENVIVRGCRIHDCTNIGLDFYGNAGYCSIPSLDQPRECIAVDNKIYNISCSYAQCAGLYVDGARDVTLSSNEVYDCQYGIEIGSEEYSRDCLVRDIKVCFNNVHGNTDGGIRIGGYEESDTVTGFVVDTQICNNILTDNHSARTGYEGEINLEKCHDIYIHDNVIKKTTDKYPLVGGSMSKEYTYGITFENNSFSCPGDETDAYFELWPELYKSGICGIDAWNAAVGGSDFFVVQ